VAYVLTRGDRVALVRRPPKGLLGGMLALPTSDWTGAPLSKDQALAAAPVPADWQAAGEIEHVFTHFALTLSVLRAEGEMDAIWTAQDGLKALPSVFLKAARRAL
jgi:A/G-specific adenine glycosylase